MGLRISYKWGDIMTNLSFEWKIDGIMDIILSS